MKCPDCGYDNEDDETVCYQCDHKLVPETARPAESGSLSSDWVAEAEAALTLEWKALNTAAQARNRVDYHTAFTRIEHLEYLLATEPRRSATEKLTDKSQRGGASDAK